MQQQTLTNRDYTVAWICALPVERTAGDAMLDALHDPPQQVHREDHNTYQLGRIGKHNVVIACLPLGGYGTTNAAIVAKQIGLSFPCIRFYLLVGVGGGIPSPACDVRLGDVVVSKPENGMGGVVQYDLGKTVKGGRFERTGMLNKPPQLLLTAMAGLQAIHARKRTEIPDYLKDAYEKHPDLAVGYIYQGEENDTLYKAEYEHEDGATCELCPEIELILRTPRGNIYPIIHYGTIASGNQLVKHGVTRDRIGKDVGAICFEMEAAGIVDHFPCLVIRGICDYSDSHKNKRWQPYAALTAAAYAKELLSQISPTSKTPARLSSTEDGIFDIPRILHKNFSGRQTYLEQIRNAFSFPAAEKEGIIISIYGIPGAGKSQLCLKYATDNKKDYKFVFYATASTSEQWLTSCSNIIQGLGLPEAKSDDQNQRKQALKRWLSAKKNWIVVIDDVTSSVVNLLKDTLPQHLGGHIILSTRDKFIATEFSPAEYCIALREMDLKEGKELVLKIYNLPETSENSELAGKISQEVGGLPLALEQGTTSGTRRCWDLGVLLENLQADKQEIVQDRTQDSHHADVVITLGIALSELDPAYLALLNLILFMRPQALPLKFLLDGACELEYKTTNMKEPEHKEISSSRDGKRWGRRFRKRLRTLIPLKAKAQPQPQPRHEERFTDTTRHFIYNSIKKILASKMELDKAVVMLEKSSLVRRGENGDIWVHDLFIEILRKKLEKLECADFIIHAQQIVIGAFPRVSYKTRDTCSSFVVHATEVLTFVIGYNLPDKKTMKTISLVGQYYGGIAKYDEAVRWYEQARSWYEKNLGADELYFDIVWKMGRCSHSQGSMNEAFELHRIAIAGFKKVLGEDHLKTVFVQNDSINILCDMRKYDEAEKRCEQLLVTLKATLGESHEQTFYALANMADIFGKQGQSEKALRYYTKALDGCEKYLHQDHWLVAQVIRRMATVSRDIDGQDYSETLKLYERAVVVSERVHGEEHPVTLTAVSQMAVALSKQGRFDVATEQCKKVLASYERLYGGDNIENIYAFFDMATILCNQHKYDEATQYYKRAIAGSKTIFGEHNWYTLQMIYHLSFNYIDQNEYNEAKLCLEQLLAGYREDFGDEHPKTLSVAEKLRMVTRKLDSSTL
ncbi:Nephrocystin-3 [Dactylellina cionopaga]|nr:Nephrocystin-3 [Dactylellina cionopaga]